VRVIRFALAGALAALALTATSVPASATRSCGTLVAESQSARITILRGSVSCAQARTVIDRWLRPGTGVKVEHGGESAPFGGKSWTMSDGWTCSEGAGGGGCSLGGKGPLRTMNPRDTVGYAFIR
jgi:hypothetical protein